MDGETNDEPTGDERFGHRFRFRRSHLERSDDELVWVGDEHSGELSRERVVEIRQRTRDLALYGLYGLLGVAALLGSLAMIGVATGRLTPEFAQLTLTLALTPSFVAWSLAARWAFPRGRP